MQAHGVLERVMQPKSDLQGRWTGPGDQLPCDANRLLHTEQNACLKGVSHNANLTGTFYSQSKMCCSGQAVPGDMPGVNDWDRLCGLDLQLKSVDMVG